MSGTICLSVFQPGSPSVSLSPRWGPLCPVTSLLTVTLTWVWVYGAWGLLWECRQSRRGERVSTKLAAPVSPHPNTTGDQVRVMSLRSPSSGPAPSVSVSFEFSLPHGSTRSWAGLKMESWAAEGRYAWASRARRQQCPCRKALPGPAALASPMRTSVEPAEGLWRPRPC